MWDAQASDNSLCQLPELSSAGAPQCLPHPMPTTPEVPIRQQPPFAKQSTPTSTEWLPKPAHPPGVAGEEEVEPCTKLLSCRDPALSKAQEGHGEQLRPCRLDQIWSPPVA